MAETWAAGSTAKLIFVPWDSGYDKVIQWTVEERDAWFRAQPSIGTLDIETQTYIRPNVPLTVNAPYSACFGANYLVVRNPAQPVDGARDETLCYFVTDTQYASPASTRLVLQLDVWQTRFIKGARLSQGFLEQGHLASWQLWHSYTLENEPGKDPNWCAGLRFYANVPEGLDIGADYDNRVIGQIDLQTSEGYVIILSKVDLSGDFGTVDNPKLTTAFGGSWDFLQSGAMAYICHASDFDNFYNSLSDYSWISQNMLGAYYVPAAFVDASSLSNPRQLELLTVYERWEGTYDARDIAVINLGSVASSFSADEWRDVQHYMKLLAYPYCAIEVSAANGSPLMLKPERCYAPDLHFDMESTALPPFTRGYVYLRWYNTNFNSSYQRTFTRPSDQSATARTYYYGDCIDSALILSNFPQYAGVSDNYVTYMASTANTRSASYQGAGWSLAASNASSQNAYEQAQRNAATAQANQNVANQNTDFQQGINAVSGGVGVLGNLLQGNIGGAASGTLSTALGYASSEASQQASNRQFQNSQTTAIANADANQRLAQYIAQGSYQNSIRQINATVQDAALTPPSVVGQTGGDGFNAAHGYLNPLIKVKHINTGALAQVSQYFKRYGYQFHQWVDMPGNLVLNTYFSFWKVQDITLECATANETEADALRGIFAKGVTVFASADAMIDYSVQGNYHREV